MKKRNELLDAIYMFISVSSRSPTVFVVVAVVVQGIQATAIDPSRCSYEIGANTRC